MKPLILQHLETMGFVTFDGEYDLNIIGIRTDDNRSNQFNDHLIVVYRHNGEWQEQRFPITTDAGVYYRKNPSRVEGTAIVVHNKQYRSVWSLGKHRGQYEALVQTGPIKVWRDNNKDEILDYGGVEHEGYYGINCHRANSQRASTVVDKWSAGCQVFANPTHFNAFMNLCRYQVAAGHGDRFSYTLIHALTLADIESGNYNLPQEAACQVEESKLQSKSRKKSSRSSSTSSTKSTKRKPRKAKAATASRKTKGKE
jgi:hypothetical protein